MVAFAFSAQATTNQSTISLGAASLDAGTARVAIVTGRKGQSAASAPPDWTFRGSHTGVAVASPRISVYSGVGPVGSRTWQLDGVDTLSVVIVAYTDVDPDDVVHAIDAALGLTAPSLSVPADGARLVTVHAAVHPFVTQTVTWQGPSGSTARETVEGESYGLGGPRVSCRVADRTVDEGDSPSVSASYQPETGATYDPALALALVLPPDEAPPYPTTVVHPVGYADLSDTVTVETAFSDPNPGDTQTHLALRRRPSGGGTWSYWNGSSWVGSETFVANTTNFTVTDAWGNGVVFEVSAASRDNTGLEGEYSDPVSVEGVAKPTVTIDGPTTPVTDTTRPFATWSHTHDQGEPQAKRQVKVFTQAVADQAGFSPGQSGAVFDTGEQTSSSQSAQTSTLANDVPYRVFVRTAITQGVWSDWDEWDFTLDLVLPDAPSITATADNDTATVSLVVSASAGQEVRVERETSDGWVELRDSPVSEAGTIVDREAPDGAHTYRAVTVEDFEGLVLESLPATDTATLTLGRDWLTDPLDPSLDLGIRVALGSVSISEREGMGVHDGIGARMPTITRDVVKGRRVSMQVLVRPVGSSDGRGVPLDSLDALRANQRTLLLRTHDGYAIYGALGSERSLASRANAPFWQGWRQADVEFIEQERP